MNLWPHQQRGLDEVKDAMNELVHPILFTSPTGGGKTRVMLELLEMGFETVVYTHRNMLREQLAGNLTDAGFSFGIRASGESPALLRTIQLSSMQTEEERVYKQKRWALHDAKLVIIDEAHDQKAEVAQKIIDDHVAAGAVVVGFSATPVDLGGIYKKLVVAGNNTELRECGALLPCTTYAPNEPAAPKCKPTVDGRYTEKAIEGACKRSLVHGQVFEHWKKLNPDARPAIGFACSVETSLGWAQEWYKRGVGAAHIDGMDTWINGTWYYTDAAARAQLRTAMESGEIKVCWNRFVLREGIDWPFVYHGIFATIFGSLTSYLQAGGRILRAHPSLDHVIIQDHGGNWWRHGSLNSDRVWELGDTSRVLHQRRERRLREKKDAEPICCPKCTAVRDWGRECPACGHITRKRARFLLQTDGSLKETEGDIFKPRRLADKKPANIAAWERTYYRAKKAGMTFLAAEALFAKENKWRWPQESFPFMPTRELDWFERVSDVPVSRLTGGRKEDAQLIDI
jgi:superfamily II DNA or RNA helicase